jgi:hypothetical protein
MKKINFWKIKSIIVMLCLLFYYKIKKLEKMELNELNFYLNKFLLYKEKPFNSTDYLIIKEKEYILKKFSYYFNKTISYIDTIVLNTKCKFGNCLIILNKILFICEIIQCKNIILNENIYWFIKNNITIQNINLSISANKHNNFNNISSSIYDGSKFYFYMFTFKPEIRINFLRDEILSNIPKITTNQNDLFIHIRSGNIFNGIRIHRNYAQPPLCFYRNILKNFKFRKIYIIACNRNNPLINKLIKENQNLIYLKKSIKEHISLLINAHKIVNSISSFINSIIPLNYVLEFLWEYNMYPIQEKLFHYHHDLFKYPNNTFIIFKMEPSSKYINRMRNWKCKRSQLHLMFKEKCINEFKVYKY